MTLSPHCKKCGQWDSIDHRCPRSSVLPTTSQLLRDSASASQQLHDAWDGEVENLVILFPSLSITGDATYASTMSKERLLAVLETVKRKVQAGSVDVRAKLT